MAEIAPPMIVGSNVPPPAGPPPAVMGARGARPVFFPTSLTGRWLEGILEIPGVRHVLRNNTIGIECTWDIAWAVAKLLNVPEPSLPKGDGPLPGLAHYRALGLHEKTRKYQKEDILFLARSGYALLAEPMRSGKCIMALGADIAVDSRRSLILGPSISLWNWAREVYTWTGERTLILAGLGAREGRLYCTTCRGKGHLLDGSDCEMCKARNGQPYGYTIFDVPILDPEILDAPEAPHCLVRGRFMCPKHPEVEQHLPYVLCPRCREELICAIAGARYVVVNYELLVPHLEYGGAGDLIGTRKDLLGWVDLLRRFPWDVAICDEAHLLRGWTTALGRKGLTRREKTKELLQHVQRVWMLTGTPFWGYTRDIWGLLDIASNGLFGETDAYVPGRQFMIRYCEGQKGNFGWQADGRSVYAETELVRRLGVLMMKRAREELFGELPPRDRRWTVVDLDTDLKFNPGRIEKLEEHIVRAIKALSPKKHPMVIEAVAQELAEGNKVVVFTFAPESAEKLHEALQKELAKPANRKRMEEVNNKAWLVLADKPASSKARDEIAEQFREHPGAGVVVTTIGIMQVAISLKGATTTYFVDLHYIPGAIFQAEDRIYDHEKKTASVFFVARGTVDDRLEEILTPRLELLTRLANEKQADALRETMAAAENKVASLDEIWARHVAHLKQNEPVALDAATDGEG